MDLFGEHQYGIVVECDLGSGFDRNSVEHDTGTVGKVAASHVHPLGGAVVDVETDSQTDDVGELRDPAFCFIHQGGADSLSAVAGQPERSDDQFHETEPTGRGSRRRLDSLLRRQIGQHERVDSHRPYSWVTIDDPNDGRLADYVRLRETSLRRHLEAEHGLFIAEGEKVIRRAVETGYRPRSFLLAERWLPGLADVLQRWPDVPVYVVSEELAEAVTGFHVHRGALASLHREIRHTVSGLLAASNRLVVIEDVVDHTNVGAVLRNAAALGWDGALLAPRAADPLYRRAIKVSMGAVFSLPWARLENWAETPELLRAAGFTTIALSLTSDAIDLGAIAGDRHVMQGKIAVLLGTEGAGLSARWTTAADVRAVIPMQAGIDSLNVAAALAVACYLLARR